jgi:hypothetical protein
MVAVADVIIPKSLALQPSAWIKAIDTGMKSASESLRVDFVATTNTWKRKPKFERYEIGTLQYIIGTDDPIWAMLERGTRPHIIRIRRARFLRFNWDGYGSYGAKTRPNFLGSKNARYPKTPQRRIQVKHPGTEARNWIDTAQQKYQKLLPKIVQRSIDSTANRILSQMGGKP